MLKKSLYILLLMLISFVLPQNEATACCSNDNSSVISSNCESANDSEHKSVGITSKKCCNSSHDDRSECPGNCDGSNCQCSSTPAFIASGSFISAVIFTTYSPYSYVWNYLQHDSQMTFNAIWQPPQFS